MVYHRSSGKTHFLNIGTCLLLREVLLEPLDAPEAATRLARLQGARVDDRLFEHVAQLLTRLDELGLVRRIQSA